METLDLEEAANFLKMNPEVLRRKAKSQEVPSRKAGKRWIFIKEYLADWVSGRYPERGRELRVVDGYKQRRTLKHVNLQAERYVVDTIHRTKRRANTTLC